MTALPHCPPRRIAVLGATGSIGASALDVIARHPHALQVAVLAAGSNVDALVALCRTHRPLHAVIADPDHFSELRERLIEAGLATQPHAGPDALDALVASDVCDTVVAAIVGAAGLSSTLAAARTGKRILLANKESLVLAGALLIETARQGGASLVPVDSEHNAIFQCLPPCNTFLPDACMQAGITRLVLTASGGPFRGRTRAGLGDVTAKQALAHPKWTMGPKISIDSATLMNKGLEVIEAHHLFGGPRIDVVVHPQSLVHSFVEFVDGSTLAQLGLPDMRTALAVGFAWPSRIASGVPGLDMLAQGRLDFEAPDLDAFPCLRLAFDALAAGGAAPAVLNAANEVAVSAFLQGRIAFLTIPALIDEALSSIAHGDGVTLAELLDADVRTRRFVETLIDRAAPRAAAGT